jgi:hypothetical protein
MHLKCFDVEPALSLNQGEVRFLGWLPDLDGVRLIFLLCRSDPSDL